jgi:signal transduction histidine kinase
MRPRLRLPRYTIRLRLAVLYGGVFAILGTLLLALIFVSVRHSSHSVVVSAQGSVAKLVERRHSVPVTPSQDTPSVVPESLAIQRARIQAQKLGAVAVNVNHSDLHQLRTPLTLERAILEVTLADPDATTASLREACERVLEIGEQQERTIDALLTLARSERGLERREPLLLDALTSEVLDERREEITRRGLRLESKLDRAPTAGEGRLIERLIANLLDNAIHHNNPDGWVAVATELEAGDAVLTVSNSGPVIAPAEIASLVRPFQRLGADRTSNDGGHGLGLSIVDAIATAHGAKLTVHAQPVGGCWSRCASGSCRATTHRPKIPQASVPDALAMP